MRSFVFVSILFLAFGIAGCRGLTDAGGSDDVVVDILEHDFRFLPGTNARIVFVEPLADSRCPSDVECVTQGSATIQMRIDRPTRQTPFVLEGYVGPQGATAGEVVSAIADGFSITLLRLDPYPVDSLANNDLYRARLRVVY